MDFKNATRLFADSKFDGDPVMIYEPKPDDPIVPPDEIIETSGEDQKPESFEGYDEAEDTGGGEVGQGPKRYVVDDVEVNQGVWREQYLDADGKLITEDYRVFLKEEIKKALRYQFGSLKGFLNQWRSAERKQVLVDELKSQGIDIDVLKQAIPNAGQFGIFDLIAHIAFDQHPLTRKERANHVKKRDYFGKYGQQARKVLEALLDKYAANDIMDIEDPKILELPPFNKIGTKTQIRREIFGGPDIYSKALTELEQALFESLSA
jgi:type I restriction enzyme R subunit